jgi:excisionase family DNA binding protein
MAINSIGLSRDERKGAVSPAPAAPLGQLEPLLVTVAQAKHVTNVGHTKLYELIKQKRLEVVKIGKRTMITFASIKRLAQPNAA